MFNREIDILQAGTARPLFGAVRTAVAASPIAAPVDLRKTIAPSSTTAPASNIIPGVRLLRQYTPLPETPMGVSLWNDAFSGAEKLGEGLQVTDIYPIGAEDRPSAFSVWRKHPSGDSKRYQKRTLGFNPDGTVFWKGSWTDHTKESGLQQLTNAAALAGVFVGATSFLGSAIAAGGGAATGAATGAASGAASGGAVSGSGLVAGTGTVGLQVPTAAAVSGSAASLGAAAGSGLTLSAAQVATFAPTIGQTIAGVSTLAGGLDAAISAGANAAPSVSTVAPVEGATIGSAATPGASAVIPAVSSAPAIGSIGEVVGAVRAGAGIVTGTIGAVQAVQNAIGSDTVTAPVVNGAATLPPVTVTGKRETPFPWWIVAAAVSAIIS